ncbi:MAG: pyridoxamine 5'-phosphate oxidase family protein [Chlamydiota bacterium]
MRTLSFLLFSLILPFALCATTKKDSHPITKISRWFNKEKERTEGRFHRFATLATVSAAGKPYTRMIELVKVSKKNGLVFFTHKNSVKVQHFSLNSNAALNIYLPKTKRQVSLTGIVSAVSLDETEKAWKRMPRFLKLTHMLSEQKRDPTSIEILEQRKKQIAKRYHKVDIPMPSTFVGYLFEPEEVIFLEIRAPKVSVKELAQIDKDEWVCSIVDP